MMCTTCNRKTKKARHRPLHCQSCWLDWLEVDLTDLTDIDRDSIGQVGVRGDRNLTDFAPTYKVGRSVRSVSSLGGEPNA